MASFPEDKLKEAILHPDAEVRQTATDYFADSYSHDASIMSQVIKAVETYGRQDAVGVINPSRKLPQTEASIDWIIAELNDEQTEHYENYPYNLSMVLVEADPPLLVPRESTILEARHFLAELRPPLTERLRMLSWDAATCWQHLEAFCEEAKDKSYTNEVDLNHARRLVEALGRHGEACEAKVHALLAQKIGEYEGNPMAWMQPLVARLAGEARLDSAVPLLIDKLMEDSDELMNEECSRALTRIGTPAVLHAIAEAFPGARYHFRLYATEPLEHIHSDLAVETALRLFDQEKDGNIRNQLAQVLLYQFAPEGIEAARRLLVGHELDFDRRELRDALLKMCTLTGERFPEYDAWLASARAEKEEHQRKMKELEGNPMAQILFALEKLTGKKAADMAGLRPPAPLTPRLTLPRAPEKKPKVGRNDPCPCGSGKKFKVCCGRR